MGITHEQMENKLQLGLRDFRWKHRDDPSFNITEPIEIIFNLMAEIEKETKETGPATISFAENQDHKYYLRSTYNKSIDSPQLIILEEKKCDLDQIQEIGRFNFYF